MILLYIYFSVIAFILPVVVCAMIASARANRHVAAGYPKVESIPNIDFAPSFGD